MNLNDTPSFGQLTEAELDRIAAKSGAIYMLPGRDTCNGTCETASGCACVPCTVMNFPTRRINPPPQVVPCSTLARLYLKLRLWWRG